jgi:cyclin-C
MSSCGFESSTHAEKWTVSAIERKEANRGERKYVSGLELRQLQAYYAHVMHELGKLAHLRQRVVATGQVYFWRFYAKTSYAEHDPLLVVPACVYLASKVEESVTHAKIFAAAMRKLLGADEWPYGTEDVWAGEFYVLEQLNFYLVVHHAYRPLTAYLADAQLEQCVDRAWALLNDSYRTSVCLQYPPHIIAIAAVYLAATMDAAIDESRPRAWLARQRGVRLVDVWSVIDELLELYRWWPTTPIEVVRSIHKRVRNIEHPDRTSSNNNKRSRSSTSSTSQ